VLRRIFEPKRNEIIGRWRKLDNEELHNFHSPPNTITIIKSRRMRWASHVTCIQTFGERAKGRIPLGRPRRRWMDNITIDLREIA
jgi:hypothetical protein